jgi:hypothetical protein
VETLGNRAGVSIVPRRKMRMAGAFFDVVDVGGDTIVFVDVADAVKTHFGVTAWANHAVAVNHPVQPLMKCGSTLRAANADFVMFDLVGVRIDHGRRPFALTMGQKSCR